MSTSIPRNPKAAASRTASGPGGMRSPGSRSSITIDESRLSSKPRSSRMPELRSLARVEIDHLGAGVRDDGRQLAPHRPMLSLLRDALVVELRVCEFQRPDDLSGPRDARDV